MSGLRPFFCFYGGKWRSALRNYPPPAHDRIIEPFAGGAGYSLRYPDRKVALCDLDPIIAGLWRYLIGVRESEILALPDVPPGGHVSDLKLCREAEWLIGFWLNKGVSAPRRSPSAWMRSNIRPNSYWGESVRIQIASQVEYIRHWRVIEGGYLDLPNDIGTWFVDPPYQVAGKHYRFDSDGIDYAQLGEWCRTRGGQVIACENEGATWLPFAPLGAVKATPGTRRTGRSREVVWTSDAAARDPLLVAIREGRDRSALVAIWRAHKAEWSPEHTAASEARLAQIEAVA